MVWQPKRACYTFCENSIVTYAPRASGVYGLYNFDYQLYIGETSNICGALLQRLGETDYQPAGFQPTGFAFEACPPGLREFKARRLINEHRPVRQTSWPSDDSWEAEPNDSAASYVIGSEGDSQFHGVFQTGRTDDSSPVVRRYYIAPGKITRLVALFAVSLVVIFVLGILAGESLQRRANADREDALVRVSNASRLNETVINAKDRNPSVAESGEAEKPTDNPSTKASPLVSAFEGADNRILLPQRSYPASAPETGSGAVDDYLELVTHRKKLESLRAQVAPTRERLWAVQLAASRERTRAEEQIALLKAKGYDGFIVERERDGEVWHRVRVGRFGTRAEAEGLREILETREGYRGSFITSD